VSATAALLRKRRRVEWAAENAATDGKLDFIFGTGRGFGLFEDGKKGLSF
jgi:hypothetical protein